MVSLAAVLAAASTLIACTTAPTMPMSAAPSSNMASPDHRGAMQAQMKTMHDMHIRMMNAKPPEERQAMMDKPMAMPAEWLSITRCAKP